MEPLPDDGNPGDRIPAQDDDTVQVSPGRTLLPYPLAHAVSLATRSTGLAIRLGSAVSAYGFDAARVTTLSSLDVGRGLVEGLLARTGNDVLLRSRNPLDRHDAESVLEQSLECVNRAMAHVVFWTAAGFRAATETLALMSDASQLMLLSLDQIFGSTDSSRAIASIIALVRRELADPDPGSAGEKVGAMDLLLALGALSYLQRRCWRLREEEKRRRGIEEVVWDVVILEDGGRVDVHEESLYGTHPRDPGPTPRTDARIAALDPPEDAPEIRLKEQILQSLPSGAEVSISTSVSVIKTITVDLKESGPAIFSPPPGLQLVEAMPVIPHGSHPPTQGQRQSVRPGYRLVYKTTQNEASGATYQKLEKTGTLEDTGFSIQEITTGLLNTTAGNPDAVDDNTTSGISRDDPAPPPPVPPKPAASPKSSTRLQSGLSTQEGGKKDKKNIQASSQPSSSFNSRTAPRLLTSSRPGNRPGRPVPLPVREQAVNQKKPLSVSVSSSTPGRNSAVTSGKGLLSKPKVEAKPAEKKGGLRQALKRVPTAPAMFLRDHRDKLRQAQPSESARSTRTAETVTGSSSLSSAHAPASLTLRGLRELEAATRSPSRASFVSVIESKRRSTVSQTDSFSLHTIDPDEPGSPRLVRSKVSQSTMSKLGGNEHPGRNLTSPGMSTHPERPQTLKPSLYRMKMDDYDSKSSLVLSSRCHRSAYSDADALDTLRREGTLDGIFPRSSVIHNVARYMLFSSASYGSSFLRIMGISKTLPARQAMDGSGTHHDVQSFAHHTTSQTDSILLTSFVDPGGGSDASGSTESGLPLVHYISLDHNAKAVVLACRGTLGFEDVLADLTCDYDNLEWRGRSYQVHKGVHASARRILYGDDGRRVLITLKEALNEFDDYGLVLCGHSLGGAVTALLGVMLAEPRKSGKGFMTSAEPNGRMAGADRSHACLPAGRPIHVYAYGPPGTMSPALCRATRGLVSSVVYGNDLVPYLSLGVLRDLHALALGLKSDKNGGDTKQEIRQGMWQALRAGLAERWYQNAPRRTVDGEDDKWAMGALATLRASLTDDKLLPPGDVFAIESTKVLRRDAFLLADEEHIGHPARRIVLKYVRDVEARFREIRFGASMLLDHSPAAYEDALDMLRRVIEV